MSVETGIPSEHAVGSNGSARIVLADDHEVVRRGLRAIISQQSGWEIVAEVTDGRAAFEAARRFAPNVVIMDISMPVLNGFEATRRIKAKMPHIEVVLFSLHDDPVMVREGLQAGARAYLLKSDAPKFLVAAVQALLEHKPFFYGGVSQTLMEAFLETYVKPADPLTQREREVVQLLAEGATNAQVGKSLSISAKTVESHRAAIMRKLGVRNFSDLVRYAIRNHIIDL